MSKPHFYKEGDWWACRVDQVRPRTPQSLLLFSERQFNTMMSNHRRQPCITNKGLWRYCDAFGKIRKTAPRGLLLKENSRTLSRMTWRSP